jgi:hypothetical protein
VFEACPLGYAMNKDNKYHESYAIVAFPVKIQGITYFLLLMHLISAPRSSVNGGGGSSLV